MSPVRRLALSWCTCAALAMACGGGAAPAAPTPVQATDPCSADPNLNAGLPGCYVSFTYSGGPNVAIGSKLQLTARLVQRNWNGTEADRALAGPATWSSGTPGIVVVDASGLVTGVSTGSATISATITEQKKGQIATGSVVLRVGSPSQYDGVWGGSPSSFGPVQLEVTYGLVTFFSLKNVSVPLQTGAPCRQDVSFSPAAPITNGAFSASDSSDRSGMSISGTFSSTTRGAGMFSSFRVSGSPCNATGTATLSSGTFTLTR